jgi:ribosomal-protein-alanine N-acetyltransferase
VLPCPCWNALASTTRQRDEYFSDFDARHPSLLDEQAAGLHHFHVLVESDGLIIGRINLVDVADASGELGYRIAERAAGRGLATATVNNSAGSRPMTTG